MTYFSFDFDHNKLWISTEADRSSTTILFASDYKSLRNFEFIVHL